MTKPRPKPDTRRKHQRIEEFCKEFGVTRAFVFKMTRQGRLKSFKLAGATILDGRSVADLMEEGGYVFEEGDPDTSLPATG